MMTYCVKCKSKTETINPKYKMSKNQKPMVQGKCVKCSKMKSQFISAAETKKVKKGGFIFYSACGSRSCWSTIWTRVRGFSNCYSHKQEKE